MQDHNYHIQRAWLFDAWAIYRLEQEIFPKDAYPLLEIALLLIFPQIRNFKLKAEDGSLVGFVSGSAQFLSKPAWIITLGVANAHQHRGLGQWLLEWCETKLKAKRVRLSVRASNQHAIALYEKTGYTLVERRPRYYHDGEEGLIMEKLFSGV